jgi:hypothetical protein
MRGSNQPWVSERRPMRSMGSEDAVDYFRIVRTLLLTVMVLVTTWVLPQSDPMLVTPGIGVDSLKLGDEFRPAFERFKGHGWERREDRIDDCAFCLRNWWVVEMSNDSLGIRFTFWGRRRRRTKLFGIELYKEAVTTKDLRIGLSTWDDVLGVHGPVSPDRKNKARETFWEQGVEFSFDEEGVVSGISVFEPVLPGVRRR